ncbi:MAG: cyclic nucleotide-binding domain-containing protein [Syntrophobacterales bacterium]|nr:MAG: cyclic nucleotide-binding domain-containing protein [Syntrophobacterales bacterium]
MSIQERDMERGIALLGETALFKSIQVEKIKKILNLCSEVRFRENEIIMKEGDIGDTVYIILEGTVEVAKNLILNGEDDEDPGNKVFTKLKADGAEEHPVFGEIALLEESKRTATIKALTDCVFYELEKVAFVRLVEGDHELGFQIMQNLARIVSSRLRRADEDVVKLTTVLSIVLKES